MPFRALLDLLFPPLCHVCRTFIPNAGDLFICAGCLQKINFLSSPLCTTCGAPFATEGGMDHTCGACVLHPPSYISRSAASLEGPVQDLVHSFKYGNRVHLCQPLGLLLADSLQPFRMEIQPDMIIPVPLHRKRLRQRGFNQSQLIGEVLKKRWKVPLEIGNLRRIRWTEPQTTLHAKERVRNVAGAFSVRAPELIEGKRVLLVDDVLTTGSTLRECAEALQDAGAAAVFAVTVARGGVR